MMTFFLSLMVCVSVELREGASKPDSCPMLHAQNILIINYLRVRGLAAETTPLAVCEFLPENHSHYASPLTDFDSLTACARL
jgi:hypothetical protein